MFLRYRWLEWALPLIQKKEATSEEREKGGTLPGTGFTPSVINSNRNNTYSTGGFPVWIGVRGWWVWLFECGVITRYHLQQYTEHVLPVFSEKSKSCLVEFRAPSLHLSLCASWPRPPVWVSVAAWLNLRWRGLPDRWAPLWGCWWRWASHSHSALSWWIQWLVEKEALF